MPPRLTGLLNDADPISLEPIASVDRLVLLRGEARTGGWYGFDAEALCGFILSSGDLRHPLTRRVLGQQELARIDAAAGRGVTDGVWYAAVSGAAAKRAARARWLQTVREVVEPDIERMLRTSWVSEVNKCVARTFARRVDAVQEAATCTSPDRLVLRVLWLLVRLTNCCAGVYCRPLRSDEVVGLRLAGLTDDWPAASFVAPLLALPEVQQRLRAALAVALSQWTDRACTGVMSAAMTEYALVQMGVIALDQCARLLSVRLGRLCAGLQRDMGLSPEEAEQTLASVTKVRIDARRSSSDGAVLREGA
jgi:hypothetical protein